MTLVLLEGFEHFQADDWFFDRFFDGVSGITHGTTDGRHGGRAWISAASSGGTVLRVVPTNDEYTVGFDIRMTSFVEPSSGNAGIVFENSGDQFTLRLREVSANSDEWRLELRRGGMAGTIVATQTGAQHLGAWHYIEVKVLTHTSAGTYEVHLDGVQLAELTATGQDTANTGGNDTARFTIHVHPDSEIDNLYILNDLTATNNDFLGPIHIDSILPNADGDRTEWTPSSGSDHFALVDEPGTGSIPTDRVTVVAIDTEDLFEYEDLPFIAGAGVVIPGVEVVSMVANEASGSRTYASVLRSDTSESFGGNVVHSATTIRAYGQILETNTAEAVAWNVADINAAEFGITTTA